MAENATQPHDTRRPAETATISGRDRVADILSDLDRGRAEALEAVQAAEALRQAARAERKAWACRAAHGGVAGGAALGRV